MVTRNSSPRSLDVDDLAEIALDVFGEDRVFASPHLAEALDVAVGLVDDVAEWGSAAVVALGSVVTAADARRMMAPRPPRVPNDARELTYNLLPEGEEPDDDQLQAGLERGLGFNLPGFDPEDDPLDDPDDDHLDADDDDEEDS